MMRRFFKIEISKSFVIVFNIMSCVICNADWTSFSIRPTDIGKSPAEIIKNSKYGDCCSMICALEKNELLIKKHGGVERTVVGTSGRKYVVVVPVAPKSKEDRTEITL